MVEWPIVGRDAELSLLSGFVRDPTRHGAVVAGPAGVGKTRLALECLAAADRAGLATARVTATRAASHLPFGALAPLLPPVDLAEETEKPGPFLRRCCALFAERATGGRLVVFVDDAHLLDDASAALILQLVTTASAFVLVTVRSAEPTPDPVVALWKDGLAERLDLGGLSADAVEKLLSVVLGGPVDRAVVVRLTARCQDNLLFLRELVLGAVSSGALREEGGLWRLVGPLSPSARLVEIVEARLAGLSDRERSLLELVAMGEPLGAAELNALADPSLAESLERQSVLQSNMDGRRLQIRLAHPFYGDTIRSRLLAIRSRELARTLADALEATGARRREDLLRVATWRLDGGGDMRADMMLAAAQQARLRWDLGLAERLAGAAVDAGAGFDAALLLGQLAFLQGRPEDAEAIFAALVPQATTDVQKATLATHRLNNLALALGRTEEAMAIGEAALAGIEDRVLRDEVIATQASILETAGRTKSAMQLLEPLLRRAEGRTLVRLAIHGATPLTLSGRITEAIELCEKGARTHRGLGGPPLQIELYVHEAFVCFALTYGGRLREAEERALVGYRQAVADGSADGQGFFAMILARALLARGRVATSQRFARESASVYQQQVGWPAMARIALMALAWSEALAGRAAEAKASLAETDGLGFPPTDLFGPELLQARAWTDVAEGDLGGARRHLQDAVQLARANGELVLEAAALHDLARIGAGGSVASRLLEVADRVEGDLVAARAAHASALAAGDAPALEEASAAFDSMGADLLAAEAAADAAVAWRRIGDLRRAAAAERQTRILGERCEGASTPALLAVESRVVLTRAERDVALLAAAGRPDKEIAEQLHLSRRTVENYLHHVYKKLGVSGRAQLASALEGTGEEGGAVTRPS